MYLLEMAQADLEVQCIEKGLTDQLLLQLQLHTCYWQLRARKVKKQFSVGRVRSLRLVVRNGFKCSEHSFSKTWHPSWYVTCLLLYTILMCMVQVLPLEMNCCSRVSCTSIVMSIFCLILSFTNVHALF
jgi:hypothetical protein